MHSKFHTNIDDEQIKYYAKTRSKIDDKSMNSQNLRFLDFCEEYNVNIVFSHDQGYLKFIKNPFKIYVQITSACAKKYAKNIKIHPKRNSKSMKNYKKGN